MDIQDYELLHAKNLYDSAMSRYISGTISEDTAKSFFRDAKGELNSKINYQTSKLNGFKNPTDSSRSNAITVACSKDYGLLKSSMQLEASKGNWQYIFYLADLIKDSKSYSNSEKAGLQGIVKEAEYKSNYARELNTRLQCDVIKAEIDSSIYNIDEVEPRQLLSKVDMDRSAAEIGYALEFDKRGWSVAE